MGLATAEGGTFWVASLASALVRFLAFFPLGCVLWRWFGSAVTGDLAWAPETPGAAILRRLYFYLASAITLAVAWYGGMQLLAVAVLVALGGSAGGGLVSAVAVPALGLQGALLGAAFLIPACFAWWWHWRCAENWARQPGPAGHEERASLARRNLPAWREHWGSGRGDRPCRRCDLSSARPAPRAAGRHRVAGQRLPERPGRAGSGHSACAALVDRPCAGAAPGRPVAGRNRDGLASERLGARSRAGAGWQRCSHDRRWPRPRCGARPAGGGRPRAGTGGRCSRGRCPGGHTPHCRAQG